MHSIAPGRVRGVVFDLWNTLVTNDHSPNPIVALARAFGVHGRPGWAKIIERAMMRAPLPGIAEGITALSKTTGVRPAPQEVADLTRIWREACRKTRLFEDVPAVLGRLSPRYRLGLLSNTQSFDLGFLEELGLADRFDACVLSWEEGALKPDPALFQRMTERLELPPSELLMVGDNLRDDVLASEAAGMQALLIRRSGASLSFHESRPDREPLRSLEPLLDCLDA